MNWPQVKKHEIAVEFLDTAIRLFDEGKYFSSLHLAGAAEEIFHDTLKDRGIEPTKETDSRLAKKLGDVQYKDSQPSRSGIEKAMDYAKNAIKHVAHNGGKSYSYEVIIRPNIEAFRMIRRTIKNATLCSIVLGRSINEFMSRNERDLHKA